MDESTFDCATREVGTAANRRQAIKTLGGIGLSAVLAAIGLDSAAAARRKNKKGCKGLRN